MAGTLTKFSKLWRDCEIQRCYCLIGEIIRRGTKMQSKISAFFKPRQYTETLDVFDQSPKLSSYQKNDSPSPAIEEICATSHEEHTSDTDDDSLHVKASQTKDSEVSSKPVCNSSKILNKKRNYAQLHLDLGQSDFLLHTCPICSFKYACGDVEDEKVHKEFHKEYNQGIRFKGWHNERTIRVSSNMSGRIILVLDGDPPAHKKKVEKVVELMEGELGSGWLIHKLCKVYLFISHQRVAGCLIAEPIKDGYKVIFSKSEEDQRQQSPRLSKKRSKASSTLQFGDINFKREAARSANDYKKAEEEVLMNGAMLIEQEAVPAVCGIRGIWVAPSMRRQNIATQLLDAARISFCRGIVLNPSELAFSDPTSMGKAFAINYCTTASVLAYKCAA